MSFKALLITALTAITLSGCSLYEGPPPARKKEFTQGNLGCLKDINAKFELYFNGKASADDVNRMADCAINALRAFGDLVRGENRDRFTAQEVRNFMQMYFLDDVTVSDAFLHELMRVKQALVGGKETDFTPGDLKEAEGLVNMFRESLLRLHPSMPLSIERTKHGTIDYVESEARAIAEIGEIFGRRITEKDSMYSFEEMGRLFDEIIRAFPGAAGGLGGLRSHLKTAGMLKEVLISPNRPRGTVTAAEWRLIFQDGSRWLGNYLKFVNMEGSYPDWSRGAGRDRLAVVVKESVDLLERVVDRHCPKDQSPPSGSCRAIPGIPFTLLQNMMEELSWDGTIAGIKFNKQTLESLIPATFRRFFGGTDPTETGRRASRVTAKHLERFRVLFQEWIDGSRYVEGVYKNILRTPEFGEDAMVPTQLILKLDVRQVLSENGGVTPKAIAVADGLRGTFSKTYALADRGSSTVLFDGKNKTRQRVYAEMARYAWIKPLMKLAVLGYMEGSQIPRRQQDLEIDGLTLPELRQMVQDYWQVLVDFKIVGPKNSPEGDSKNRFREAALFTQASDGNQLISIDEGVQLILYMFSANPQGDIVHKRMARLCQNGPLDDYGEPTLEPKCYRKYLYDFSLANHEMADLWVTFPIMIQFYESLDEDERENFREKIELAVRKPGKLPTDFFGSDDSDALPMLFHYIEALFLRFDTTVQGTGTSGDGFVDRREAKVAFPIFRNVLAEDAKMDPQDSRLESVFTYLLANGKRPTKAAFVWWSLWKPKFKADRLDLLKVFATLANSPVPAPSPSPAPKQSAGSGQRVGP